MQEGLSEPSSPEVQKTSLKPKIEFVLGIHTKEHVAELAKYFENADVAVIEQSELSYEEKLTLERGIEAYLHGEANEKLLGHIEGMSSSFLAELVRNLKGTSVQRVFLIDEDEDQFVEIRKEEEQARAGYIKALADADFGKAREGWRTLNQKIAKYFSQREDLVADQVKNLAQQVENLPLDRPVKVVVFEGELHSRPYQKTKKVYPQTERHYVNKKEGSFIFGYLFEIVRRIQFGKEVSQSDLDRCFFCNVLLTFITEKDSALITIEWVKKKNLEELKKILDDIQLRQQKSLAEYPYINYEDRLSLLEKNARIIWQQYISSQS